MTITLAGSNFYSLKRRLDELAGKFLAEHGELALERIDAEEADPAAKWWCCAAWELTKPQADRLNKLLMRPEMDVM